MSQIPASVWLFIAGLISLGFGFGCVFSYAMERTRWSLYRKEYRRATAEAKAIFDRTIAQTMEAQRVETALAGSIAQRRQRDGEADAP
jgi:hypothetical protein